MQTCSFLDLDENILKTAEFVNHMGHLFTKEERKEEWLIIEEGYTSPVVGGTKTKTIRIPPTDDPMPYTISLQLEYEGGDD
jgi:hypothetical protein